MTTGWPAGEGRNWLRRNEGAMPNIDFAVYTVHGLFWSSFGLTLFVLRSRRRVGASTSKAAVDSPDETAAPFSRAVLAFHVVAFTVMYIGMAAAVLPQRVPEWFSGQRVVGSLVIASGAVLVNWAMVHFQSWRFRAKLDEGHQLATGGPFRILRHPIYMGLNLLAFGTAIWVPTTLLWIGFILMAVGSDLRARVEEPLLERAFGRTYREYTARTRRFIPGIY
jgi:protein-S-isoprenylcysteine O-methyltransferase Ste14